MDIGVPLDMLSFLQRKQKESTLGRCINIKVSAYRCLPCFVANKLPPETFQPHYSGVYGWTSFF
jgi:hypothetical protein